MQTQYSVLLGRTNSLCFYDCKLATKFDENDYSDRIIDYEMKR